MLERQTSFVVECLLVDLPSLVCEVAHPRTQCSKGNSWRWPCYLHLVLTPKHAQRGTVRHQDISPVSTRETAHRDRERSNRFFSTYCGKAQIEVTKLEGSPILLLQPSMLWPWEDGTDTFNFFCGWPRILIFFNLCAVNNLCPYFSFLMIHQWVWARSASPDLKAGSLVSSNTSI